MNYDREVHINRNGQITAHDLLKGGNVKELEEKSVLDLLAAHVEAQGFDPALTRFSTSAGRTFRAIKAKDGWGFTAIR